MKYKTVTAAGVLVLTAAFLGNMALQAHAEEAATAAQPQPGPRPELRAELKGDMRMDLKARGVNPTDPASPNKERMGSSTNMGPGPKMGDRMEKRMDNIADRMENRAERFENRKDMLAKMADRLEERDAKRAEMQKEREGKLEKVCEKIGVRIETRVEAYQDHHEEHVTRFNEQKDRLEALIKKLESEGVNVDTLKKDLVTLGEKIKTFADLKASHIAKLEATKSVTCGDATGEYKQALADARTSQQAVFKAAQDIVSFFRNTIVKDVQALKGTLKDIKPKKPAPVEADVKAEASVDAQIEVAQ